MRDPHCNMTRESLMFNALEPQEKKHTTATALRTSNAGLSLLSSRELLLYGAVYIEILNFGREKNDKRRNPAAYDASNSQPCRFLNLSRISRASDSQSNISSAVGNVVL
jgi:hypothetical protein